MGEARLASPMRSTVSLVPLLFIQAALAYDLSDTERATLSQVFAKHATGGKVPIGSLRALVTDTVVASTAKKFSVDVQNKHVDFLMAGFQAELPSASFTLDELMRSVKQLEIRDENN